MKKLLLILIVLGLITACSKDNNHENNQHNDQHLELATKPQQPVEEKTTNAQTELDIETEVVQLMPHHVNISPSTTEHIAKKNELPKGFVYLDEVIPYANYEIRYYSTNNFVGERVEGYKAPLAIATKEMANALTKVSEELYEEGYTLLIYDTYRPAKAVSFFKDWSLNSDESMKEQYYPNEQKNQLFKRGYLASKSGHSRGSTVDLTLVHKDTNELVDMGSDYDLLDEISSFNTKNITEEQASNRKKLMNVMIKHGFKEYSKEWWHYVLKNEPYPKTYFDFNVE